MKNEKIAEQYISDFRKTDPLFREHLYQFVVDSAWTDELANVQSWNIPVCVIFGKNESLLKTDYLDNFPALWKKRVFLIEDAGHFPNEEQVELFNNILISYAEERFK
jgi:pimeloyl-ACP methyl ester carboxylesterase